MILFSHLGLLLEAPLVTQREVAQFPTSLQNLSFLLLRQRVLRFEPTALTHQLLTFLIKRLFVMWTNKLVEPYGREAVVVRADTLLQIPESEAEQHTSEQAVSVGVFNQNSRLCQQDAQVVCLLVALQSLDDVVEAHLAQRLLHVGQELFGPAGLTLL